MNESDLIPTSTRPRYRALDKDGWPVETIKGRPIQNAIRLLLHTRRIARWEQPVLSDLSGVGTIRAVEPETEGGTDG